MVETRNSALPLDVCKIILENLSEISETAGPLLTAMRTNRTFYGLGTQVLLDRGVVLDSPDAVMSFCSYLSEHNFARAPLFRSTLSLQCPLPASAIPALSEIVRRATALKTVLIADFDEVLGSAPALVHALVDATGIKTVNVFVREPTATTSTFFADFQSALTSAVIHVAPPQQPHECEDIWSFDPISLLTKSLATLTTLDIAGVSMTGWDSIILPMLDRLDVSGVKMPATDILARSLPRLSKLQLYQVYWATGEPVDIDSAPERRAENRLRQERWGSWSGLEYVRGPEVEVYALGLTCPVTTLMIEEDGREDAHGVMLSDLLRDIEHLGLMNTESFLEPPAEPEGFEISVLRPQSNLGRIFVSVLLLPACIHSGAESLFVVSTRTHYIPPSSGHNAKSLHSLWRSVFPVTSGVVTWHLTTLFRKTSTLLSCARPSRASGLSLYTRRWCHCSRLFRHSKPSSCSSPTTKNL